MDLVIDTNVILVANSLHDDVSDECISRCVNRLREIMSSGRVVIDDRHLVISEYMNKLNVKSGKLPGDVFVKWLLRNLRNENYVVQVTINETGESLFAEFANKQLERRFDPPDRKFVAVAMAHRDRSEILQAADCKWLDWWRDLEDDGVVVHFMCPDDVCRFYTKKFPKNPAPQLPNR
jgi:hypothetical protein